MPKKYYFLVEKGRGGYIATVAGLPGCCAEGIALDKLAKNTVSSIKRYIRTEKDIVKVDFIGVQMAGATIYARRKFAAMIERENNGRYILSIPSLPGCFTQAETLEKLINNAREAIGLYLSVKKDVKRLDFVGVQIVEV